VSGTGETAPARPGKSPAAFRTISEVAEDLDLPPHVLRFWESKFPQLQPLKRGGGRRYYRPEDIRLLRHIRQCLYRDGYSIRGVQKLLGPLGDERVPESGRPILPATTPTLFPLDASAADPPPADRPPGTAEEQPTPEKPVRRPRRRPSGPSIGDPQRRAALEEIRRELLQARAALAELLGPPKSR
jgi:DNA-binding transcriptional MerR regulator